MISRIGKLVAEATGSRRFEAAQALRSMDVVLVVDARTDLVMARSAVALSLRCFTGKTVVRPARGRTVPSQIAQAMACEAAEYGAQERLSFEESGRGIALGLGCPFGDVFVGAQGWCVSVNERGTTADAPRPPAAAFAAAAGVGKAFGTLLGRTRTVLQESWTAPMLDFSTQCRDDDVQLDLGRIVLIGAGAIGSALAHVLRASRWRAEVKLVDYQRYDEPNHETTLLVAKKTTMLQAPKASALAACLRCRSTLTVEAVEEKVTAGHRLLIEPAEAIVCAVDNPEVRRLLDQTTARVVLNAGVGGSREDAGMVLWTRHRSGEVPLSAYYSSGREGEDDASSGPEDVAADACSRLSYAKVALAAPFMGLAAGALLAAGLVQEALRAHAPTNYFKIDMLGLQRHPTRRAA